MSKAISVQGVGKEYRLGEKERYKTLRESLSLAASAPLRALRRERRQEGMHSGERLWALDDVSFDVATGEAVGLVGANGAGKSTMLKILSRITEPTRGSVTIAGRVASLLEVGTGFHPELTGRENIFLNGAMLGMSRRELVRRFDEIVEFSGVERFIDTPVKRYSSGMYVRLAFAVAAHVEPEVLLVDEVLAVGDAAFQKKCLGKMGDVASAGRTVLFVSHNIGAISALCSRALLFETGRLVADGPVADVTRRYQTGVHSVATDGTDLSQRDHYGSGRARFVSVEIVPQDTPEAPAGYLCSGDDLLIRVRIQANTHIDSANVAIVIYDSSGYRLVDVNTALAGSFLSMEPDEEVAVSFRLRDVLLKPGTYVVGLWLGRGSLEDIDGILYAATFPVEPKATDVVHWESFPGPYQCRFTHEITRTANREVAEN